MTHLAIMNWSAGGRVTKHAKFDTLAEAEALAAKGSASPGGRTGAYAAPDPGGQAVDWLCDPVAKTVVLDPLPPPPAQTDDAAYDELVARTDLLTKHLKSLVKKLNDGTFVPGGNLTNAQLKALFKVGLGG